MAVLGYFGCFGLFLPFWAILMDLGYFGRFGLFWLFWAIMAALGYFGCFGLFWLFWAILPVLGYFGCLGHLRRFGHFLGLVWSCLVHKTQFRTFKFTGPVIQVGLDWIGWDGIYLRPLLPLEHLRC